jgi:hypothetical protein
MYRSLLIIAVCLFLPFPAASQPMPGDAETINGFNIYNTLDRLASEEFRGRHTGHEGYTDAASWVAEMFNDWGLEPASEEHGYLLPFPVQYTIIDDASMSIYIVDEDADAGYREIVLEPEADFLPLLYSDSADRTADVVFIGWGIHAPDTGYDDYFGVDVQDKFVMCFRGTPDPQDRRYQHHDEHRTRMQRAKEMGAIGLIYIYEEPIANPNGDWIENFTPVKISYSAADKLLGNRGFNSSELRADLLKYKRPLSFEVTSQVRIRVASTHFPDATGFNVAGYIEGENPELRDEVIVVGAHLDHCGTHMGLMFPGADDNASGSAVVIEIARAFAENNVRTGRSILFTLFGGEEMGLIGSRYLVENFPQQFTTISYMINFDMVGAGDGAVCGFSAGHPDLRDLVENLDDENQTVQRYFPIRDLGVRGSDHAAFHAMGVPVLYFVSNGPHIKYHTTGDTIYRMNPSVMEDIARIGYLAAIGLGNR